MKHKLLVPAFILLMAALSAGLFLLQFALYHRMEDPGFYLLQDLAFLPINVLLVSLGVNAFLSQREKRGKLEKVNLLIGEFFIEYGFTIMNQLHAFIENKAEIAACASSGANCAAKELKRFSQNMRKMDIDADASRDDLTALRTCLLSARQNLLALFENPNLMEHDRFTEMLWALYHLMDELRSRDSLDGLPPADMAHLSVDIRRAYALLVVEWAYIVRHMRERYPYLYSIASRKNPFEQNDVIIKEP